MGFEEHISSKAKEASARAKQDTGEAMGDEKLVNEGKFEHEEAEHLRREEEEAREALEVKEVPKATKPKKSRKRAAKRKAAPKTEEM